MTIIYFLLNSAIPSTHHWYVATQFDKIVYLALIGIDIAWIFSVLTWRKLRKL